MLFAFILLLQPTEKAKLYHFWIQNRTRKTHGVEQIQFLEFLRYISVIVKDRCNAAVNLQPGKGPFIHFKFPFRSGNQNPVIWTVAETYSYFWNNNK